MIQASISYPGVVLPVRPAMGEGEARFYFTAGMLMAAAVLVLVLAIWHRRRIARWVRRHPIGVKSIRTLVDAATLMLMTAGILLSFLRYGLEWFILCEVEALILMGSFLYFECRLPVVSRKKAQRLLEHWEELRRTLRPAAHVYRAGVLPATVRDALGDVRVFPSSRTRIAIEDIADGARACRQGLPKDDPIRARLDILLDGEAKAEAEAEAEARAVTEKPHPGVYSMNGSAGGKIKS